MQNGQFLSGPDMAETKQGEQRGITPRFFTMSIKCSDGSYKDIDYVELLIATDKTNTPHRKVSQDIINRFPTAYRRWKETKASAIDGMPLERLFGSENSIVLNLKLANVFTVEQLADLDAQQLRRLGMGAQEWQRRAKAYLQAEHAGTVDAEKEALRADNDRKDALLEEMAQRLAALESSGATSPLRRAAAKRKAKSRRPSSARAHSPSSADRTPAMENSIAS